MKGIFDVIVIGAGISGIGASRELTKHSIPHLILEARDRIGGRIASKMFNGLPIQLGASYVHFPNQHNKIAQIIREKGQKYFVSIFEQQQFFFVGKGPLEKKVVEQARTLFQKVVEQAKEKADKLTQDISLQQSFKEVMLEMQNKTSEEILGLLNWELSLLGNIQGARLNDISTKQLTNAYSFQDIVPERGYPAIVQDLFKQCKCQINFNQFVTKIDYSQEIIKIYTKQKIYYAKKLISSLPLGILQSNTVQFIPSLPQSHTQAVNKLGNGVANKLFVSFVQPFWNIQEKMINFVQKGLNNRYSVSFFLNKNENYVLCFFVSIEASHQLSKLTKQEICEDLLKYLGRFNIKKEIKIKDIEMTNWERDPFSLGSYSYFKAGAKPSHVQALRSPIDNKIWFIGQHCHPQVLAEAHTAFETGIWASEQIIQQLK